MNLLDKTVSAIVHTIASEHDRHPSVRRSGPYLGVTEFVSGQVAHMTAPLRLPMRIATCGLSVLALLTTGSLFHRLTLERRDVIRFYDSLTVLALYGSEAA
jgi:hypothetical protein